MPRPLVSDAHCPNSAQRAHIRPIVSGFSGTWVVVMSRLRNWVQVVPAWSLAFLLLAEWTVMGASWNGPSGTSAVSGLSST